MLLFYSNVSEENFNIEIKGNIDSVSQNLEIPKTKSSQELSELSRNSSYSLQKKRASLENVLNSKSIEDEISCLKKFIFSDDFNADE